MRHDHDSLVQLPRRVSEQVEHLLARARVERAGRLVAEHHVRSGDEGARDRHPLLLAAGELGGAAVTELREPHRVEQEVEPPRLEAPAAEPQREGDVVLDVQGRQQVVRLEHEAHVIAPEGGELTCLQARDLGSAEVDGAAAGPVKSRSTVQQRALARAGGAHDRGEGALRDGEVHAAEGGDAAGACAVGLDDGLQAQRFGGARIDGGGEWCGGHDSTLWAPDPASHPARCRIDGGAGYTVLGRPLRQTVRVKDGRMRRWLRAWGYLAVEAGVSIASVVFLSLGLALLPLMIITGGVLLMPEAVRGLHGWTDVNRRRVGAYRGEELPPISHVLPPASTIDDRLRFAFSRATGRDLLWLAVQGIPVLFLSMLTISLPVAAVNSLAITYYW